MNRFLCFVLIFLSLSSLRSEELDTNEFNSISEIRKEKLSLVDFKKGLHVSLVPKTGIHIRTGVQSNSNFLGADFQSLFPWNSYTYDRISGAIGAEVRITKVFSEVSCAKHFQLVTGVGFNRIKGQLILDQTGGWATPDSFVFKDRFTDYIFYVPILLGYEFSAKNNVVYYLGGASVYWLPYLFNSTHPIELRRFSTDPSLKQSDRAYAALMSQRIGIVTTKMKWIESFELAYDRAVRQHTVDGLYLRSLFLTINFQLI